MAGKKSPDSIESTIFPRLKRWGRGCVVLPADFPDLGSWQAIGIALHRLEKAKTIRRLTRGVYDYPKTHPKMGLLSPAPDRIAIAIAGRDQTTLQPSGAYAANLLGLSEQVPARIVYLTDGAARSIRIGKMTIQLRQTTPRNMATAGRLSGLIIQAFRYLGKEQITPGRITILKTKIPLNERRQLLRDLKLAPAWMHPHFHELAGEEQ
jgi:hypothetical protein